MKDIVYDYLRQHKYMALATASLDGVPEVATVEYLVDGDSLLINTYNYYRKYPNLISNGNVAGVVTMEDTHTLQFDAFAKELSGEEAERARQLLLEFEPGYADYFNDETTRFFRITPTWLRLRDYTQTPMKTTEYHQTTVPTVNA
jgi:uncharacterized pyridoxamine 5'-phosphate oxidase family protein